MMLEVSKDASSFLSSLQAKQYKQIANRIFDLGRDPNPHDSKHLTGRPGFKRIDSGEYRVIYRADDNVIYITIVGKRNDDAVYKDFNRK